MAGLSEIATPENEAQRLRHPPAFEDHHVGGKPVLPAVEAMEALAAAIPARPETGRPADLADAVFDKFLFLDKDTKETAVHYRAANLPDGSVRATLQTKTRAPNAAITRTKTHAEFVLKAARPPEACLPLDLAAAPEGICRQVAADRLYAELVPFGPAYRNIVDTLFLGNDGALAQVASPRSADKRKSLVLGSPYPLDAAFHAACVWSQYTRNIVAFPVALEHRKVIHPTRLDATYLARVVPAKVDGDTLVFNIFIFDRRGRLCEVSTGVQMRDVSGGRNRPPAWIRKRTDTDPLARVRPTGIHLAVIEPGSLAPFARQALSTMERERHAPMVPKRQKSFVAAHLALKRLSRELAGGNRHIPPGDINTVRPDSPRPVCPSIDHRATRYCSVSHDSRFAVAAAAKVPLGIDVEEITAKALNNRRLFTTAAETGITNRFSGGELEGSVRIWSAKEAAAKALNLPLASAWKRCEVIFLGQAESQLKIEDQGLVTVKHAVVDGHLFTLLMLG